MSPREDNSEIPVIKAEPLPLPPPIDEEDAPIAPIVPAPIHVIGEPQVVQVHLQKLAVHHNIDGVRAIARLLLDLLLENHPIFDNIPNN